MSGDASYQSVYLLLACDGTDGSTTFTDTSPTPKTVTASGNAHIETDQAEFGTASAYFDGTGDYLSLTGTSLGTDDFTIEGWIRIATPSSTFCILDTRNTDFTNNGFSFYVRSTSKLTFGRGNPFVATEGTTDITADTRYHVALTRSSGTVRGYLDGSREFEVSDTKTFSLTGWRIGHYWNASGTISAGYIDDLRITLGVARYTGASYSVPAAALPGYMGQIAGTVLDDAGDPVARVVRAYRRDTGAMVGNTTSSAGDGSYLMNFATLDECIVICLDDAAGDDYNDLVLRVTPA